MASVRAQIFATVKARLDDVLAGLGWTTLAVNPREALDEAKWNALVLMHGGDRVVAGLTGMVERRQLTFSVGALVREANGRTAEDLLDDWYVAVRDGLVDPDDIQLGGLAEMIEEGDLSDPAIGRSPKGAWYIGAQLLEFTVQYLAREGDATVVGP